MLIDTHGHLNFHKFDDDRDEVVRRCQAAGMKVINPSSQLPTSQAAVELAKHYPGDMYAAVGFHPTHTEDTEFSLEEFQRLFEVERKHIHAVGEIGLDYYRLPEGGDNQKIIQHQKDIFRSMFELATKQNLPKIIHCRDAYDDLITELRGFGASHDGVIHCYLGSQAQATQFLDLGFYLGFTGIITFTDDEELLSVIKTMPLDRMLAETDAPYLTPVPLRGKRNEPLYVKHVIEKIAELRGLDYQTTEDALGENARRLFRLPS